MLTSNIPFDSLLARHLWMTSHIVRESTDFPQGFREVILRRFEQIEQLVTDRSTDLLVERVIDCRLACYVLDREGRSFAAAGGIVSMRLAMRLSFHELYRVGINAVRYLGRDAVPSLLRACLRDDLGPFERNFLAWMLDDIDVPELKDLTERLKRGDWDVAAIQAALDHWEEPEPEPPPGEEELRAWREKELASMLQALQDANEFWRWRAVEALAEWGDPSVLPALAPLEEDPDEHVRAAASAARERLSRQAD